MTSSTKDLGRKIRLSCQLLTSPYLLQSLCQLLAQIENIVISDAVGGDITASLTSSIDAQTALGCGDMATAYAAAQLAVTTSERAFFHQSLLALLYFPDDQKYFIVLTRSLLFTASGPPHPLYLYKIIYKTFSLKIFKEFAG